MNKFIAIGVCILLTGCFQSSASLIGPVYTLGSSGNIYQAGLSYGVNQTIQKTTGQTSFQYSKNLINKSKNLQIQAKSKVSEYKKNTMKMVENIKINSDEFFATVKSNIEKNKRKSPRLISVR